MNPEIAEITSSSTVVDQALKDPDVHGELDRSNLATEGQVLKEAALASAGYTVSVRKKVVLSKFRNTYLMRSSQSRMALIASETSDERLSDLWREFRHRALSGGSHETTEGIASIWAHKIGIADSAPLAEVKLSHMEERGPTECHKVPMGMPNHRAMRMATNANSRHYVLPETAQHSGAQSASQELAYTLIAYGLASTTQARQPEAGKTPHGAEQPNKSTKHHVLLVDDVDDVLVSVGAFLVKEGYAVHKAASGDEALRLIASDPRIEVLITDYAMPGLTGGELIALAVQMQPKLKALVITGYPNADGLAELPSNTSVLVKPFRRNALIASVKSLLMTVPSETVELRE